MNIIRKIDAKKLYKKQYLSIFIGAMVLIISGILAGKNESKQVESPAYRRVVHSRSLLPAAILRTRERRAIWASVCREK